MGSALVIIGFFASVAILILMVVNFVNFRKAESKKSPEQKAYDAAQRQYNAHVAAAEKLVKKENKTYRSRVSEFERKLSEANNYGNEILSTISGKEGKFEVTAFELKLPNGSYKLDGHITGYVDVAGNIATKSRSTLTRTVGGGLVFGPIGALIGATARKSTTEDYRELYLLLEGSDFAAALTLDPDKGQEARQFLQSVLNSDKNAVKEAETKRRLIENAVSQLNEAKNDTALLDKAKAGLTDAKGNTDAIVATRQIAREANPGQEPTALKKPLYKNKKTWLALAVSIVVMVVGASLVEPTTPQTDSGYHASEAA